MEPVQIGKLKGLLRRPRPAAQRQGGLRQGGPSGEGPREEGIGALILLHGRGADEYDLAPLFDELDPDGRLWGVTLRGPLALPPGGAHWYVVRQIGKPDRATFHPTYAALAEAVDQVAGLTGVPPGRTILGGFSQGAVMTYAAGLGPGRPRLAGLLPMSGFVPEVDGFALDLTSRAGLPVRISHGSQDPVISVQFGRRARDLLTAAGMDVTYLEEPVGHHLTAEGMAAAREWVRARIESFERA